jgi:hypothetical protein
MLCFSMAVNILLEVMVRKTMARKTVPILNPQSRPRGAYSSAPHATHFRGRLFLTENFYHKKTVAPTHSLSAADNDDDAPSPRRVSSLRYSWPTPPSRHAWDNYAGLRLGVRHAERARQQPLC